jgi:hypothetical protein
LNTAATEYSLGYGTYDALIGYPEQHDLVFLDDEKPFPYDQFFLDKKISREIDLEPKKVPGFIRPQYPLVFFLQHFTPRATRGVSPPELFQIIITKKDAGCQGLPIISLIIRLRSRWVRKQTGSDPGSPRGVPRSAAERDELFFAVFEQCLAVFQHDIVGIINGFDFVVAFMGPLV